jgi:hypothetical protein
MNNPLIAFYVRSGSTASGFTHFSIRQFDAVELEGCHDFIQWLFPTKTPSRILPDAPLLDDETIAILKGSSTFHLRFERSMLLMLDFLGIRVESTDWKVRPINFHRHWMTPNNHNLLRMSRMMESCRLLGYEMFSQSLFLALYDLAQTPIGLTFITADNLRFWKQAAFSVDTLEAIDKITKPV